MRVLPILAVVTTAASAAALSAARADRAGEVVRVERKRLADSEVRVCPVSDAEGRATCFGGGPPKIGSVFWFVGLDGALGRARVARVDPSHTEDACSAGGAHDLTFDAGEYFETLPNMSRLLVAIGGLEIGPGARLVFDELDSPPSGRSDEAVWLGLDRTGSGSADFVATGRPCPTEAPPPGSAGPVQSYCIGYWLRDSLAWRRVGSHVYHRCP